MALPPKPQGGFRTVAKTPMWYRLFAFCRRKAIKEWECQLVAKWDAAAPGRQALDAALRRALLAETAVLLSEKQAIALWDFEKNDTVDPALLFEEALQLVFRCLICVWCVFSSSLLCRVRFTLEGRS